MTFKKLKKENKVLKKEINSIKDTHRWINVDDQEPPKEIDILAKSPAGLQNIFFVATGEELIINKLIN